MRLPPVFVQLIAMCAFLLLLVRALGLSVSFCTRHTDNSLLPRSVFSHVIWQPSNFGTARYRAGEPSLLTVRLKLKFST